MADRGRSRLWISTGGAAQSFRYSMCDLTIQSSIPGMCVKVQASSREHTQLPLYDFFDVYDGRNTSSRQYADSCSMVGKSYTYSTGDSLLLQYRLSHFLSNLTAGDDGFWLDFSAESDCEIGDYEVIKVLDAMATFFDIPSQIQFERNKTQVCRYVIETSRRLVIQLYLSLQPALPSGSNCTSTQATVSDDMEGQEEIGRWCGGQEEDYVSKQNRVYIQYTQHSGHSGQCSVMYTTTLKEQCHESLSAPESASLILFSPNYPAFYPNDADCSWKINALRPNYRVEVRVQDISTGPNVNCSRDYLALHTEFGVKRMCSPDADRRPMRSRGPVMQVDFHSDGRITDKGFRLTYQSIKSYQCNETLQALTQRDRQQFISSPFFPDHYHDSMSCYYLIQTTDTRVVQTEMEMSELSSPDHKCTGDTLTFFDGMDERAPVLGSVCGAESRLPKYRSTGRYMYLVFTSNDDGETHRGFQLQYYSVFKYEGCEGDEVGHVYGNKSHTGHIVSPFYPSGFPGGTSCRWQVSVGSGYQVQVSVDNSDLPLSCLKFQVKFYDGTRSSADSLGSWCGGDGKVLVSTKREMTIILESHAHIRKGFRISYKATGPGPKETRTALVIGIIVGSTVLVVLIFTIVICCCCCFSKDKRRRRKSSEEEKREEEDEKPLQEEKKSSPDENFKTHLIVPSAPPMEGVDNSGFGLNNQTVMNPDAIQPQLMYPELPQMKKNSLYPADLLQQMNHQTEQQPCPGLNRPKPQGDRDRDRRRERVGQNTAERSRGKQHVREIQHLKLDQVPLVHQQHVHNTPQIQMMDQLEATKLKESVHPKDDGGKRKVNHFGKFLAKISASKEHADDDMAEVEKQNLKLGNKNTKTAKTKKVKGKPEEKKEEKKPKGQKSKQKSGKEELKKKCSIECDDSDQEQPITPVPRHPRTSQARRLQQCEESCPYPNCSDYVPDLPYYMTHHPSSHMRRLNVWDISGHDLDYRYRPHWENYPHSAPCCPEALYNYPTDHQLMDGRYQYPDPQPSYPTDHQMMDIRYQYPDPQPSFPGDHQMMDGRYHYRDSQYSAAQQDLLQQQLVQADVHSYPLISQYNQHNQHQSPVLYNPSLLYQNPGNSYIPGSYYPYQTCPMQMSSGAMAPVPQQIWSTGQHKMLPEHSQLPTLPLPAETNYHTQAIQYPPLPPDIRPVPLLVPIHTEHSDVCTASLDTVVTIEDDTDVSPIVRNTEDSIQEHTDVCKKSPSTAVPIQENTDFSSTVQNNMATLPEHTDVSNSDQGPTVPKKDNPDVPNSPQVSVPGIEHPATSDKSSGQAVPKETSQTDAPEEPVKTERKEEAESEAVEATPPDPSDLADLFLPSHWMRSSIGSVYGPVSRDIMEPHPPPELGSDVSKDSLPSQHVDQDEDEAGIQVKPDSEEDTHPSVEKKSDSSVLQHHTIEVELHPHQGEILEEPDTSSPAVAGDEDEKEEEEPKKGVDVDVDVDVDHHQHKLEVLLQSGFTLEDVQDLNETSV